jgi:hypothetical protein
MSGDLILYWPNGDPAIRFQGPPNDLCVAVAYPGAHVMDSCSMVLNQDQIEAMRVWCDERLSERVA